jgi:cytochrome c oxidase subunit 2
MAILNRLLIVLAGALGLAVSGTAYAGDGQPSPWEMGFQKAATPIMEQITSFHTYVTIIITLIALFVMVLLLLVMRRFNEKANPEPSRTTHHTPLEIAWTVVPILILVAIAIPSFRLLFAQYDFPKADLTVTATGNQWYWTTNWSCR